MSDPPNRIIMFCLQGFGDAIPFTPALVRLRKALPEAHITAMTMFRRSPTRGHAHSQVETGADRRVGVPTRGIFHRRLVGPRFFQETPRPTE
jgi:hypothetical protein